VTTPRVWVVLLNWNGLADTLDCIASLERSEYSNLDVLVVDNGSVENPTTAVQRLHPDVRVVRVQQNIGFTGGNNLGIQQALTAGADYVLLLNNDTVVAPDCISKMVSALEGDSRIGAGNPKIYFFQPEDHLWFAGGDFSLWTGITKHRGRGERNNGKFDRPTAMTFATGCAFFVRVSALKTVGMLDDRLFIYCEDVDLSLRLRQAGYECRYIPEAVAWHKEGMDTKRNRGQQFRIRLSARNLLLVVWKHAKWYHYLAFLPNFLIRWILFYTAHSLYHRDLRSVAAVYQGVFDAITRRDGPPPSDRARPAVPR